jgi:hypothetical protein
MEYVRMKKIAFYSNQLCIRGTTVALYDYALYNEQILGNKSYIISDSNKDLTTLNKFKDKFEVFLHDKFEETFDFVKNNDIEYVYFIKSGEFDGKLIPDVKNLIHVVFQRNEPHGEKYVYIAEWLANKMCGNSDNFVPHIIDLPQPSDINLRKQLNIPDNATVLGRHGGMDQFDFDFTHQAIIEALNRRDDLYFVFMNTQSFYKHPRIIHIKGTYNLQNKSNFINMCDGMIHARRHGEIFSLSIGEFLFLDKPVISCIHGNDEGHLHMLKDKGIWYSDYNECLNRLLNFNKNSFEKVTFKSIVQEYTPKNVMKRFNDKFLS